MTIRGVEKSTGLELPSLIDIYEVKTELAKRWPGLKLRDVITYSWTGPEWAGHPDYGRHFVRATATD